MTITLNDIAEWLRNEYNEYMSVYEWENCVRLTNGSAAMYVDIVITSDGLAVSGEQYGEIFKKTCDQDKESLLTTLSHTF